MKAGISIVIPSWNGLDLLKRFLPSVIAAAARYSSEAEAMTEIIIVDDGSLDETALWLAREGFADASDAQAERRLLRNGANLGFGETCNRGFEAARYPLVFLLNNDVEIASNSIAPLAENFTDPMVFAAHCNVFEFESGKLCGTGKLGSFSQGSIRVHRSYVARLESVINIADDRLYSMFASGGSAMFDRQKFLDIGGFEKLLTPFYWEDVEISYRAWKRGYTVLYEPRSVAHHRVSSTMRKVNPSVVRIIQQRNRLIYHWINLHDSRLIASHILWVLLLALTAPFRLQFYYLAAVFAALKRLPEIRDRRNEEKRLAKRTDREVFDIFASLQQQSNIFAYDSFDELQRLNEKAKLVTAKE